MGAMSGLQAGSIRPLVLPSLAKMLSFSLKTEALFYLPHGWRGKKQGGHEAAVMRLSIALELNSCIATAL